MAALSANSLNPFRLNLVFILFELQDYKRTQLIYLTIVPWIVVLLNLPIQVCSINFSFVIFTQRMKHFQNLIRLYSDHTAPPLIII